MFGDVNFLGHHPQWPECTDAMVLEFEGRFHPYRVSHEVRIQSGLKSWKEMGADKPFILYFAPDVFHKINASGGDPYGIVLPDSNVDGTVDLGDRTLSFIEYIRLCFTWGGFPGFADLPEGLDAGMIRRLAIDLLPI